MRRIDPTPFAAVLLLCGLSGCASLSGGAGDATTYTADLGTVAFADLTRGLEQVVIDRHGYALDQREEQYASLYYSTVWRQIGAGDGELAPGVTGARDRIVIRGRRSDGLYRVTFHGERRIRTEARPAWHRAPIPESFVRQMDEIVDELDGAVRRPPGGRAPLSTGPGGRG